MVDLTYRQFPVEEPLQLRIALDKAYGRSFNELLRGNSKAMMVQREAVALILAYAQREPVLYTAELQTSNLKMFECNGILWALYLAFQNEQMDPNSRLYKAISKLVKSADVVIGSDLPLRMPTLLNEFLRGRITDVALTECMTGLRLGNVYVIRSRRAKDYLKLLKASEIPAYCWSSYKKNENQHRESDAELAESIIRKYRRDGRFFDEIVEEAEKGVQITRYL